MLNEKDFYNLRNDYKSMYFSQYFVDTLDPKFEKFVDHKKVFQISNLDTNFITTDPGSLAFLDKSKTFYIPNVCDSCIDILKNYNYENLEFDIFCIKPWSAPW